MNLIRLLALALAVWLLYRFVRRLLPGPGPTGRDKPKDAVTGNMVKCAYCGLHVPENEALRSGNEYYCSAEHRSLAGRRDS